MYVVIVYATFSEIPLMHPARDGRSYLVQWSTAEESTPYLAQQAYGSQSTFPAVGIEVDPKAATGRDDF